MFLIYILASKVLTEIDSRKNDSRLSHSRVSPSGLFHSNQFERNSGNPRQVVNALKEISQPLQVIMRDA